MRLRRADDRCGEGGFFRTQAIATLLGEQPEHLALLFAGDEVVLILTAALPRIAGRSSAHPANSTGLR